MSIKFSNRAMHPTKNQFLIGFGKPIVCWLLLIISLTSLAEDKLVLQLKSDHGFQYSGYYTAQWQGLYKKQDLNVEIKPFIKTKFSSNSSIDEVISKRADIGIGDLDVLMEIDEGHDLVILAPIFQKSPTSFYTLKENEIKSINDLTKLSIAVVKDSFVHLEVLSLFKLHGFDAEHINFKFIPPTVENLIKKRVDVIASFGISDLLKKEKLDTLLIQVNTDKFSGHFYSDVLYTHRSTFNEKSKIIQSFISSSLEGWEFTLKNKKEIIQKIERDFPSSTLNAKEFNTYNENFAENIEDFLNWPSTKLGHSEPSRWFNTYNQLKSFGILHNNWSINDFLAKKEAPKKYNLLPNLVLALLVFILLFQLLNINRIQNYKTYFLFSALLILSILFVSENSRVEKNRQNIKLASLQQLNTIRAKLIEIINSNLSILKGLAAHISTNPNLTLEEYNSYCQQVIPKKGVVINLAAAPNLIVNMVYPLIGNEGVLGLNYNLNQPQRDLAIKVKEKGDIVVAGPVKLVQGGEGIIGRIAVNTVNNNQSQFWGIVSIPLNLQKILLLSGVYNSNLDISIRGRDGFGENGDVFYGNPILFNNDSRVDAIVLVGDGSWQIAAVAKNNFNTSDEWIWLLRLIATVALSLLFYFFYIKQEQLNKSKSFKKSLDENKKLLLEVGELAHIGGWRINSKGEVLQWTAEKDTVLGKHFPTSLKTVDDFISVFAPAQSKQILSSLDAALKDGEDFDIESFYQPENDNKRWLRIASDEIIQSEDGFEVTGAIQDISEYKEINQKLEYQNKHDRLTELINRKEYANLLEKSISSAKHSQTKIAVLYIDIDDFKSINDNLGHEIGDQLLINLAQLIQSCLTLKHPLSRYSGDEFVAFIEYTDATELENKLNQILKIVSQPLEVSNSRVYCSCSIGVSVFPDHSESAEELINKSNLAMYDVKINGKNNIRFYTDELLINSERKQQLRNKLFHAFSNHEFEVHYQPIINFHTHRIEKIEALVRWYDENGNQYNTEEFIKIAEESGLINDIDLFVIDESIKAVNVLTATSNENIEISFNVSPSLFINNNKALESWIKKLIRLREQVGITIEITEHSLIQNPEKTKVILNRLKEANIDISIDDFGVGYSSLIYLTQFPIDQIKIDRSFVSEIGENSKSDLLIEVILKLAKDLNIKVVAEGIENETQLNFLINRECEYGQGYFFCKAHPIDFLANRLDIKY